MIMATSSVDGQGESDATRQRQQEFDAGQLQQKEKDHEFNSYMDVAKSAIDQSKM
jgi:hypothetical protein